MGILGAQTSAEVAREAESERADLGNTLDQLRENLRPANVVDEVMAYARVDTADLTDKVWQTARSNPIPAVLIGIGVAMMLGVGQGAKKAMSRQNPIRERTREAGTDSPSYRTSPSSARTNDRLADDFVGRPVDRMERSASADAGAVNGPKPQAQNWAYRVPGEAQGRPDSSASRDAFRNNTHRTPEPGALMNKYSSTTSRITNSLSRLLEEQPLVLAALGIAVGAAVGSAIPSTDVEAQLMGGANESFRQNATAIAKDQLAQLKATANNTLDEVKQTATDHGISSENLSGLVHDLGNTVKSAAFEATERAAERLPG